METIHYADFEKVELRTGTITRVEPFPRAKNPSYKVWVDFGPAIGTRQTSAQIVANYSETNLIGRQVIGCVNLGPKNIAGFISDFLLVGFSAEDGSICLAGVDPIVPNGQKLH